MAAIGTIATVIGAVATVYAFLFPADLTSIASQILQRMNATPILGDSDRFVVEGIYCREHNGVCEVVVKKDTTAFAGSLLISVCSQDKSRTVHSRKLSFGRIGGYLSTELAAEETEMHLSMTISAEGNDFTILERWVPEGDRFSTWYRTDVPAVEPGAIDCTANI